MLCDLSTDCRLESGHPWLCPPIVDDATYYRIPVPSYPWHQISGDLWQGGSYERPDRSEFESVFTLYHRAPRVPAGIEHKEWLIPDSGMPDAAHLDEAVAWVQFQLLQGRRTLVRCQAGLNRSGLVVARVLIDQGAPPSETIHLIRRRRSPYALCNTRFETYLRSLA